MSVLIVEHDGYTLVQVKYYVPIIGGYGFVILDEMMQIKKQGATKHRLTPIEAEWMISNLKMVCTIFRSLTGGNSDTRSERSERYMLSNGKPSSDHFVQETKKE